MLDEPLNLDMILPGQYTGLIIADRWSGVYPDSGGTNGFPSTVTDEMKTMCGVDSVTDTPVPNTTSSGIPNAAGTSSDYRYVDASFPGSEQE